MVSAGFLNYLRVREWQDVYSQLRRAATELGLRLSSESRESRESRENSEPADYEAIHKALLPGLLSHIGNLNKDREYNGARNLTFLIFPALACKAHA